MGTLQAEALLVDDLLDFSCGYIGGLSEEGDDCAPSVCGQEDENSSVQVAAVSTSSPARSLNSKQEAAELLYSPPEDLAGELEWLSTFVEDSYRGEDHSMPLVSSEQWFSKSGSSRKEGWCGENNSWRMTSWLRMDKSGSFCQILDMGSSPLIETRPSEPGKLNGRWDKRGRSKRSSRSGGRVWSLQTVIRHKRLQEDEDEDEEEHSQTSSLDYEPFCEEYGAEERQSSKKKAKKERCVGGGGGNEESRRCSHCQVQKTPQWRAGPLGPKTLCNACGVRFKSGRLLPEYRPAASPTFVTDLHSNSHKKVLEMRSSRFAPTDFPQEERHAHLHNQPLQQQDQEELSSSTCSSQESISSLQQY